MNHEDKRRHRRIPVRIPVTVRSGSSPSSEYLTEDVSIAGTFVRTDTPVHLRQLVQLEVVLPTTNEKLRVLAMVAHRLSTAEAQNLGRVPGMGLNLYGLGHAQVQAWEAFVEIVTDEFDRSHDVSVESLAKSVLEPIRRNHPRTPAVLRAHMPSVDSMYEMLTRDISEGGTFLNAEELQPVGTRVQVVIVHPEDGSEFSTTGKVVRVVESPVSERGVAIAFDPLNPQQRAAFETFIESGIPMLEDVLDEEILIEADDPLLL